MKRSRIEQMQPEASNMTSFNAFIAASTPSVVQALENSMGASNNSKQITHF